MADTDISGRGVFRDLYSQSKALYHSDRLNQLHSGQFPVPVHVQLILSDLCNQDCGFCAYRMSGGLSTELFATTQTHNPNRKIDTDKALEIIDDCAALGVKAIQFTGGGEPTVHRDHAMLIRHAQSLGLDTALVTNSVKLDPADAYVTDLKWIRVSVDAGTEQTYEKTRHSKAWHRVWRNIAAIPKGPVVGVGFVVTNDNYREIPACAALAKEYGADNIRIGAVFSEHGIHFYDDINPIIDRINDARQIADDGFEVVDLFGRRLNDLENGSPDHPECGYQHFTTYIGADLNVYRCCNTAYTTPGLLGSLKNVRFRDFKPNFLPFDARKCRFCQFRGQNEAIRTNAAPDHVNFV